MVGQRRNVPAHKVSSMKLAFPGKRYEVCTCGSDLLVVSLRVVYQQ
jgi:hypothetical protein